MVTTHSVSNQFRKLIRPCKLNQQRSQFNLTDKSVIDCSIWTWTNIKTR